MYELVVMLWQQTKEEVKKKELTTEDIDMGFDITLTKHKGQVIDLLHAHLLGLLFLVVTFSQSVHDDSSFFVDCVHHYFINYYSRSSLYAISTHFLSKHLVWANSRIVDLMHFRS
jgi:hypothetical protein